MGIERFREIAAWSDWKIEKSSDGKDILLGGGSFGKVYRAVREEYGMISYSAIKIISVPKDEEEIKWVLLEGQDEESVEKNLKEIVASCVSEIKLMESLKANSNIVSIEDYKVLAKTGNVGWDIFIRMELLTSFDDYISGRPHKRLSEVEVIKLGKDILSALELFSQMKNPIIHRDVKPGNIFVSDHGFFKLGDFGIARELQKTMGNMSRHTGSYNYMAPEVSISGSYDATADTYSLGLILYQLLNNNRLPFLDPKVQLIVSKDREDAFKRRFNGEPLPAPADASKEMAQVILKACAFDPSDRYQTPAEFKKALYAISPPEMETIPAVAETAEHLETDILMNPMTMPSPPLVRKRKKGLIAVACASVAVAIVIITVLIIGTRPPPLISVADVSLNISSVSMSVEDEVRLTHTILPDNATNARVTWSSSDTSVATVSDDGFVTAVSAGNTTIIVTAEDGDLTAICHVTVITTSVESVALDKNILALEAGQIGTLTATTSPANALNSDVTWSSNNTRVATVADGVVTAVGAGSAIITATSECGRFEDKCTVKVQPRQNQAIAQTPRPPPPSQNQTGGRTPPPPQTLVRSVSLGSDPLTLNKGQTYTLTPEILPSDATNKNTTWDSSRPNVARVLNGVVTAISRGNTTITVKTECGNRRATRRVIVIDPDYIPPESVSLGSDSLTLNKGQTYTLIPEILPANATNKNVTWDSGGRSDVATVNNGVVTAVGVGNATITVKTVDGGFRATRRVVVTVPPDGVTIDSPGGLALEVGGTSTLKAVVSPDGANKEVTWSSSDSNVARVEHNTGVVTAVSEGTATITVTTVVGNRTATYTVTVTPPPPNGITLDQNNLNLTLAVNAASTLRVAVTPANADQRVTWSSSNHNVATVSDTGVVTAVSEGTATITVTTVVGGRTATCTVTITPPLPESVTIDHPSGLRLEVSRTGTLTPTVTPANADQRVTWSSSNHNVATVSDTGVVTAVSEGTATITVTTVVGGRTATRNVTVSRTLILLDLNPKELTLALGATGTLIPTVSPENTPIMWSSNYTSIATVDINGVVTAIGVGEAIITVRTECGSRTASSNVKVVNSS
jgi:uncharacterized protein YjdB